MVILWMKYSFNKTTMNSTHLYKPVVAECFPSDSRLSDHPVNCNFPCPSSPLSLIVPLIHPSPPLWEFALYSPLPLIPWYSLRPPCLLPSIALSLSIWVVVKYPSIREKYCWNPVPPITAPCLSLCLHTNIFQPACMSGTQGRMQHVVISYILLGFRIYAW